MVKFFASLVSIGLLTAGIMGWLALDRPIRVVHIEGELSAPERREVQAQIAGSQNGRLLTLNLEELRRLAARGVGAVQPAVVVAGEPPLADAGRW